MTSSVLACEIVKVLYILILCVICIFIYSNLCIYVRAPVIGYLCTVSHGERGKFE